MSVTPVVGTGAAVRSVMASDPIPSACRMGPDWRFPPPPPPRLSPSVARAMKTIERGTGPTFTIVGTGLTTIAGGRTAILAIASTASRCASAERMNVWLRRAGIGEDAGSSSITWSTPDRKARPIPARVLRPT